MKRAEAMRHVHEFMRDRLKDSVAYQKLIDAAGGDQKYQAKVGYYISDIGEMNCQLEIQTHLLKLFDLED